MSQVFPNPAKPVAEKYRPELTQLPRLTFFRQTARYFIRAVLKVLAWFLLDAQVQGSEHIPSGGPILVVSNHLGDIDVALGVIVSPRFPEILAKSELYDYPLVGSLLSAYGVIWLHRGLPDRRALRAAIQGLAEGRMVAIAPEGRESLSGALEQGTMGAAYLAIKTGAPILPVTFTGTQNAFFYQNLRHLRRTRVTVTIKAPFHLPTHDERHSALAQGTHLIMQTLAKQLPPEYQGAYQNVTESIDRIEQPARETLN